MKIIKFTAFFFLNYDYISINNLEKKELLGYNYSDFNVYLIKFNGREKDNPERETILRKISQELENQGFLIKEYIFKILQ